MQKTTPILSPRFSVRTLPILGIGVVVSAAAGVVMVGWVMRSVLLTQVVPTFAPMQFNTALLFLLASVGLIAAVFRYARAAQGFGAFVAVFALLTIFQYLFGFNFGIDTLFLKPFTAVKTSHPGRMAPNTALSFLLIGAAVVLLGRWKPGRGQLIGAGGLASVVLGMGVVVLAGYFSGVEAAYRWGRLTAMAVHTSTGFILLGTGILTFSWRESRKIGGTMPRWYLIPVGIGFLTLAVVIWQALAVGERQAAERVLAGEAENLRVEIKKNISHQLAAIGRMAGRWQVQGGTPRAQWEFDAKSYINDFPGLLAVAVADSGSRLRRIVPAQFEDERLFRKIADFTRLSAQGTYSDLLGIERARISSPFDTGSFGTVFLIGAPLNINNYKKGFIVGIFNPAGTFRYLGEEQRKRGYAFSVSHGDHVLVPPSEKRGALGGPWLKETTVKIGDMTWRLQVWPRSEKLGDLSSPASTLVLVIGFVMAGLGTLTVRAAQNARLQTLAAERVNVQLEAEIENRKRAEDEVRRFQRRLEMILDSAGEGICGFDYLNRRVDFANPAAERMLGWTEEEMKSKGHHELFHHTRADGSPYPREECPIYATFTDGGAHQIDDEIFWRKDGAGVPVEYVSSPVRDEDGSPIGVVMVFRDITERKRQEETLQRTNAELSAANKELEAFSYSVSHDLRAPLRALDGFSHALAEDYDDILDDTAKGYLQRIRDASRRMGALIDDLLGLSRLSRRELEIAETDLSGIAGEIAKELRQSNSSRSAELIVKDGLTVRADGDLMRVALQNLLGNAWKFTGKQDDARIEFGSFRDQNGQPVFFVRDNGPGFDMAYADKLFSPFQRLHRREEFDGTGIGLATVQRIIHRHGGRIWADATPGKGAAFYFTL